MKHLILKPGTVTNGSKTDVTQHILETLVDKGLLSTTDCCTYTVVGGGGGGATTNTVTFNTVSRLLTTTVDGIAASVTIPTTAANVTTTTALTIGLTTYPIGTPLSTILSALAVPVDLSYVASPTQGLVNNTNGTAATITLATAINAGLMSPAQFSAADSLAAAATTTQIPFGVGSNGFESSPDFTWDNTTKELTVNGKMNLTGGLDPTYVQFVEHTASGTPTGAGKAGIYVSNGTDGMTQNHPIYKDAVGTLTDLLASGATAFFDLTDVPSATGKAGQFPTVNATEDGIDYTEFTDAFGNPL